MTYYVIGDVDVAVIVPIDDAPGTFDQFPVRLHACGSQLWNNASPLGHGIKRLGAVLCSFEYCKRIRRGVLGDELDNLFKVESRGVRPPDSAVSHRRLSTAL